MANSPTRSSGSVPGLRPTRKDKAEPTTKYLTSASKAVGFPPDYLDLCWKNNIAVEQAEETIAFWSWKMNVSRTSASTDPVLHLNDRRNVECNIRMSRQQAVPAEALEHRET